MTALFFTWQTILDILLITAGLFFLYRTLLGLGTWKIVSGILVSTLFFIVASLLDLRGVEWIYRNLSHVAVLSLVVLFQPELRKIFEKAAWVRQTRRPRHDEDFSRLIAESMWRLAKKNIGALVVIPGRESITEWVKGGHPLDARPSIPLILSIFDPNSPGHDGALILDKGRFTAFGVRLPVSQSSRLSEEYGTRHQAAMGLSEKTDAMVMVVSEERGQVSVFKKGTMTPMESEDQASQVLVSHCRDTGFFQQMNSSRQGYKKIVPEMAGSLAVALLMWFTLIAGHGEMLEKIITVPVEYTATAEGVVMTGAKANEVRLHLSGSKSDFDTLSLSTLSVKISLAKLSQGKQTLPISKENIRLPRGIRLLDIEPSSLEVSLANLTQTALPIIPQIVGALPKGFSLVSIEVKPDNLSVFLPSENTDKKYKTITTTPIYLDNIRDATTLYCKIISPPAIQPIEKRWPDVEVIVIVKPEPDPEK